VDERGGLEGVVASFAAEVRGREASEGLVRALKEGRWALVRLGCHARSCSIGDPPLILAALWDGSKVCEENPWLTSGNCHRVGDTSDGNWRSPRVATPMLAGTRRDVK
jgi:hypothetical protein